MTRALLLLASCNAPQEPPLRLRLLSAWDGEPVMGQRDDVDEACALLGVECVQVDKARGAVSIQQLHIEGWNVVLGSVVLRKLTRGCQRGGVADWHDPEILAHEIGHTLLGLGHHDDPDNLMANPPGWELTQRQRRRVVWQVRALWRCR